VLPALRDLLSGILPARFSNSPVTRDDYIALRTSYGVPRSGMTAVIAFYVASITGIAQFLPSFRKVKRARVSAFYLLRGRASTFTAR